MTDNLNSNDTNDQVAPDTDDLDAFTALVTGKADELEVDTKEDGDVVQPENDVQQEDEDTNPEDDSLATDEDDDNDDDEDEDEPEEVKPEPKKSNKKSAQERINELTAKLREAERKAAALEAPFKEQPAAQPKVETTLVEPDPDAVDAKGNDKYPMGDLDPAYLKDLVEYNSKVAQETFQRNIRQQQEEARIQIAKDALHNEWASKVEKVMPELPDFFEKGAELEGTFASIDPTLSEYLANTIMEMEAGPQVLYYLANNLDEAQAIVAKGAVKATIALGKLEEKLSKPAQQPAPQKKISSAPQPPPVNKGIKGGAKVAPDTDNLDDFEQFFLKKK